MAVTVDDPVRTAPPQTAPAPGPPAGRRGKFQELVQVVGVLAGLLFGGMYLGMWLAAWLAPGSHFGRFLGFLMLPLSFGLGMTCWFWTANALFFTRFFRAIWRARREKSDFRKTLTSELMKFRDRAPPGTIAFVPVSLAISSVAGLAMGLIPGSKSILVTLPVCSTIGLAYGVVTWRLARSGLLPMPEEV